MISFYSLGEEEGTEVFSLHKISKYEKANRKEEKDEYFVIKQWIKIFMVFSMVFISFRSPVFATDEDEDFSIPSHVLTITQENTYPNTEEDQEVIEPSDATKELLDALDRPIENPRLIKLLNETTIRPSPIAFGYRGNIYLGRWPLYYESERTGVIWDYQEINTNEINNVDGTSSLTMHYMQKEQKEINGALINQIKNPEDVKKLILLHAKEKTNFPLSFQTIIGKNTKKDYSYNVPVKKHGFLKAYAPAVHEKGQMIFGEVYIQLKGSKKSLVIKNVTKQGIGAWIPIQDHVSFSFELKDS